MVQILIYYPYFDGTSTSLIDTYFNLKRYNIDVECYIAIDVNNAKQNVEYIQTLRKSVPNSFQYQTIPLSKALEKQYDNLIMSFGIFRFVDKLPTKYKRLFLFDAGSMAYDSIVNNCKHINLLPQMKNMTIYGNKTNCLLVKNVDYKIWYHKFSQERFDYLKNLEVLSHKLTEDKREITGNLKYKYLLYNELHYNRWREIKGQYRENIGKMIFEFSALGKKVIYSPKNKNCQDGLQEYLALFGIDDTQEQQINISEEQLFDVLGMHEDDILLNDIRESEL